MPKSFPVNKPAKNDNRKAIVNLLQQPGSCLSIRLVAKADVSIDFQSPERSIQIRGINFDLAFSKLTELIG